VAEEGTYCTQKRCRYERWKICGESRREVWIKTGCIEYTTGAWSIGGRKRCVKRELQEEEGI